MSRGTTALSFFKSPDSSRKTILGYEAMQEPTHRHRLLGQTFPFLAFSDQLVTDVTEGLRRAQI